MLDYNISEKNALVDVRVYEDEGTKNDGAIADILPKHIKVPRLYNNQILFPEINLVLRCVPQSLNTSQMNLALLLIDQLVCSLSANISAKYTKTLINIAINVNLFSLAIRENWKNSFFYMLNLPAR